MGMVEDVGSMVSTIKRGDRGIAPFAFSDGTCEFCHKGLYTNCLHDGQTNSPTGRLSVPTRATSSGTCLPQRTSAPSRTTAYSSLKAKMPVGRSEPDRVVCARARAAERDAVARCQDASPVLRRLPYAPPPAIAQTPLLVPHHLAARGQGGDDREP
jgi:hypothetical protein